MSKTFFTTFSLQLQSLNCIKKTGVWYRKYFLMYKLIYLVHCLLCNCLEKPSF